MAPLAGSFQLLRHGHILYAEAPHDTCCNVYCVDGEVPTIIDPGSREAWPHTYTALQKLGIDIGEVQFIATHGHLDHVSAFHEVLKLNPKAKLHVHHRDIPAIISGDRILTRAFSYDVDFEPIPIQHLQPIEAGCKLKVGSNIAHIIELPGHSPGQIGIQVEIDGIRIIFTGDALEGSLIPAKYWDKDARIQAEIDQDLSTQRMKGEEFDWILNGHEHVVNLPHTPGYIDYRLAEFDKGFHRSKDMRNYRESKHPYCIINYNTNALAAD